MTERRALLNPRHFTGLLLGALAAGAMPAAAEDDPRLAESRAIVAEFGAALKSELLHAMAAGGPTTAIDVCKQVAPGVASELSRRHGARVSRTSLRVRNPANLPTGWQSRALRRFDEQATDDKEATPEFFEARADGSFRYMKAIPTAGVCLACHGREIPQDVQERLDAEYPHDRARGYEAGEVRGAFSVIWPAPAD